MTKSFDCKVVYLRAAKLVDLKNVIIRMTISLFLSVVNLNPEMSFEDSKSYDAIAIEIVCSLFDAPHI